MVFASVWRLQVDAACWRAAVPRGVSVCPPEASALRRMSGPKADTPVEAAAHGPAGAKHPLRRLVTLKRRPEFLNVRGGARWATPAFVLEAKRRRSAMPGETPRFGFTVSKQVGGAVERNRIKRRLKAATRDVLLEHARRDYDYVLIARRPALDAAFAALVSDLANALERVHARSERPPRGRTAGG
jgi:ribonuclease P protein component